MSAPGEPADLVVCGHVAAVALDGQKRTCTRRRRQGWSRAAGNENTEGRNTLRMCVQNNNEEGEISVPFFTWLCVLETGLLLGFPPSENRVQNFPFGKTHSFSKYLSFLLTRQLNVSKYFLCHCYQSYIWHLIKYSNNVPSHQNSLVIFFMN